jgi:thymidine phosphorylase
VRLDLLADIAGHVADIDPLALGLAVRDLGGGRRQPNDAVDPLVGVVVGRKLGDAVGRGDVLATVHARTDADAQRAIAGLLGAFRLGDAPRVRNALIAERLGQRS